MKKQAEKEKEKKDVALQEVTYLQGRLKTVCAEKAKLECKLDTEITRYRPPWGAASVMGRWGVESSTDKQLGGLGGRTVTSTL